MPFVNEMKELEKRIIIDIQRTKSFVIASLKNLTADLSQRNNLAKIKRHGVLRECHTCSIVKDFWTSSNLDLLLVSYYYHLTNSQFEKISAVLTEQRGKELATKYGLHLQLSILDKLKYKRHL
ncbi:8596_t:CDS:1 [Cetraspora pellucida]|uniref:8596_t:CDS:1 n=1 Tax=Cetraspora pellucida TaxID=1433469 RepID=A0A9N9GM64_9GLOM|nr:8596_t:CDS:1 [Cetraspora pellucida]